MSEYMPPITDLEFVLKYIANFDALPNADEDINLELVRAVLEEAGKLAASSWARLNAVGDKEGAKIENSGVITTTGFKEAYLEFVEAGWMGVAFDEAYGGQNMPWSLAMATVEMWQSANLSLSLCPLLTHAAIEAIHKHGTDEQKEKYLPKLIEGSWTGTMNLTEPNAGTDLAAIKTTAKKQSDGTYLIKGQKIFITFGDHDFTDNVIHLVLAHIDGMEFGNHGLGLFIVPKYLVNDDGALGDKNDVVPISLEHKLGINGSPTCVMSFGENEGAVAYLVGKEGEGLKNMFTMMNNARISVGQQGVAISERAYQHALTYAKERVQCGKLGDRSENRVAIIEHADVRRMLLTMKALTEAGRAMAIYAGSMIDIAKYGKDEDLRQRAKKRTDLMTPLVKAWCTDNAVKVASLGVQIHGGMGFVEESGAAQYYRDARILPIYEGTNGIQANDLMFRKLLGDGGAEMQKLCAEIKTEIENLNISENEDLKIIAKNLETSLNKLQESTNWLLSNVGESLDAVAAAAVPYLKQAASVVGGYMMAKMAHASIGDNSEEFSQEFLNAKLLTARFFAESILPEVNGIADIVQSKNSTVTKISNEQF